MLFWPDLSGVILTPEQRVIRYFHHLARLLNTHTLTTLPDC